MILFYRRRDGSCRSFQTPEEAATSLMEIAIEVLTNGQGDLFIVPVDKFGNEPPEFEKIAESYDDFAIKSLEEI